MHISLTLVVGAQFKIPLEYCDKEMTIKSSLSCLLPGVRGESICSLGLVHFLTNLQNNFMENYSVAKKFPYVSIKDKVMSINDPIMFIKDKIIFINEAIMFIKDTIMFNLA